MSLTTKNKKLIRKLFLKTIYEVIEPLPKPLNHSLNFFFFDHLRVVQLPMATTWQNWDIEIIKSLLI